MTPPPAVDPSGLEVLTESECLRLLTETEVGRIGVTVGALPAIFPVNYRFVGGQVLFYTGEGTKLSAAVSETVVAFESDSTDPVSHTGWSVEIVGIARVTTSESDRQAAEQAGLQSWASADRHHLVAISPARITGRRLAPAGPSRPMTATGWHPTGSGDRGTDTR
jgi:hypothetical protein